MAIVENVQAVDREAYLEYVISLLDELSAELDVGEIGADTRLGDLGVESLSLVYLIAEIQQRYALQDRLFARLRRGERTIGELRVGDLVDLVCSVAAARDVLSGGAPGIEAGRSL